MSDQTYLTLVLVVMPFVLLLLYHCSDAGHPFTEPGRAKLHRRRALRRRAAELIRSGHSKYQAFRIAELDLQQQARTK